MISLYGSAVHPNIWMRFYESLGKIDIDFECIFVGPVEPEYTLPPNCRFIKSLLKPVQCWEIALRECRGEFAMNFFSDTWFVTPNPLGKLMSEYESYGNPKAMVSPRYTYLDVPWQRETHRLQVNDPSSPCMPVGGLCRTQLIHDVGGIDRNFIAQYWDLDVAMRIHQAGGTIILSETLLLEDHVDRGRLSVQSYYARDRALLDDLWGDGHSMTRKRPVEPFSIIGLMTESQGEKGRW